MEIEQVKMAKVSSKGQIVIPQSVRNKLKIKEGNIFAVALSNNTLVLKKIENSIKDTDFRTQRMIDEAWQDIEQGRYKIAAVEEFEEQARKW